MNKKITKLMAALALLTILAVPIGMWGQTTYEQLTSIANIDESAQYVLGIDGTGFHYSGTSSWGLTALPSAQTPIYYTLTKASDGNSFTAQATISETTYYLQVPTTNTFSMATSTGTNTDLIIGTTQVTETNYAVANKTTTTRHLRINGASGLRSYAGTTGTMAFFYKVVTSSGPVQLDAPNLTATPSNEKVTLTWNNVTGASSYTIQYADNSSFTGATTIPEATSPKEFTGLTNGTTYYFKAMSVGDGTDYISSDYGTVVTATPSNIVTITITQDDITDFTNSYAWYNWADGGVSGKVYAYKNAGMQFNSAKDGYWIYNSVAVPGNITSVKMTKASSATDRSWTLKAGTSALTTTNSGTQIGSAQTVGTSGATWNVGDSYNYFLLYVSGGSTVISSIEISYAPTSSSDPSISADDVDITYDATGGSISYTINNVPDPAGTLTAAIDGTPTIESFTLGTVTSSTVPFTCAANSEAAARTATVTLTYTYGSPAQTVTKNITITQAGNPDAVNNISDITEVGTAYTVKGTIVATNNRGFVIGDGTGYVYTYLNATPSQAVGDMVKVSGTTGTYGQIIQFTSSATITVATESSYTTGTPAATVITAVPDYSTGYHLSTYLEFEGALEKSSYNYYITVGGTQIQVSYPTSDQETTLTALDGKTVHVKGYFSGINSSSKFTVMLESAVEVTTPSITLDSYSIDVDANEHDDGSIAVTYNYITTVAAAIQYYEEDGVTEADDTYYDWLNVGIDGSQNIEYIVEENTSSARTAYFKVWAYDDDLNPVYSDLITITQAAPAVDYATLPFDFDGVKADIGNTNGLTQNGLGNDYASSPKLKFDSANDSVVLKTNSMPKAITFNVKGNPGGSPSYWGGTFKVQTSEDGKDYTDLAVYDDLASTTKTFTLLNMNPDVRYIKWVYTEKESGNVALGKIYVDEEYLVRGNATVAGDLTLDECTIQESGKLTIKSGTLNVTNALTNEATSEAWNNLVIKDGAQLKTPNAVKGTIEKFVAGYGESTNGNYVLLATPATLDACNNTGMWTNTAAQHAEVDFYAFDQSFDSKEWRNFKYGNTSFAGPLAMTQGTGYLYANKNDVTLTLETRGYVSPNVDWQDHPFAPTNDNQSVTLEYSDGKPFAGYNLIGNPFTCDAYINRDYYRMNAAGDAIVPAASATTAIKPCEGIFVVAANTSDNTVTFTTTAPSPSSAPANVVINLKDSEMVRDRAIVSFDGERDMPRFQFNDAAAKLYIPEGEKEMAKVSSEAQGEMPVNFKADKNGSFTLNVDAANLDVDYLHLIDNLTGADIDLLQTPSYTFDARTTDYASRFRLMFSINNVPENEDSHSTFAYFNGSEWVINASDNATVQVVDVMGRVILNADAKHGVSTANMPAGVYMLRLVNGNNVKVQKIVVR